MRRLARPAVRALLRMARPAVQSLLRNEASRSVLNRAYERSGEHLAAVFNRLLGEADPPVAFAWKVHVGHAAFQVPVLPELPRSWSTATYWNWPPAFPLKAAYTWYLTQRSLDRDPHAPFLLLDVGANDGLHSYPFVAHGWRSVCFEPQETCAHYVGRVVKLNHFRSLEFVRTTVGDREEAGVPFYTSVSTWFSSFSKNLVERFEGAVCTAVPMTTLDCFCADRNSTPTCIKIDVEGYELAVLRGAETTLRSHRPDLFIEIRSQPELREQIWEMLTPLGYRLFAIERCRTTPFRPITKLVEFLNAGPADGATDFMILSSDGWGVATPGAGARGIAHRAFRSHSARSLVRI